MNRAPRDLRELAGLYALDALEPGEAAEFEQFLEDSPEARREVDEFLETAARLGAAEATTPPAGLKGEVMAEIATTRQERPRVVPFRSRRAPKMLAVAAVAAAFLLLAGLVVVLDGRVDDRDEVLAVLGAPDAVTVELDVVDPATGQIRVVWSEAEAGAVVFTDEVADAGEASNYALWGIDGTGAATALGFFESGDDPTLLRATLDAAPTRLAVTIEPAGGSAMPTADPVAVGDVT